MRTTSYLWSVNTLFFFCERGGKLFEIQNNLRSFGHCDISWESYEWLHTRDQYYYTSCLEVANSSYTITFIHLLMGYTLFTYINRKSFYQIFLFHTLPLHFESYSLHQKWNRGYFSSILTSLWVRVIFLFTLLHVLSTTVVFVSCLTTSGVFFFSSTTTLT